MHGRSAPRSADAPAGDGRAPGRGPGGRASALSDRDQAPRLGQGHRSSARDRWQRRVLRLGRPEPEVRGQDGRDEARQVRRSGGDRGRPHAGSDRTECGGDGGGAHGREHARRTRAAPRRRRDGHEREDDRGHQHRCRRSPDPGRCPGLGRVAGSHASGGRCHPDRCRRDRLRRAHQRVLRQAARVGEPGTGRGRCHRRVDLGDAPRHRVPDAAGHSVRRHREQRVARRVAHQERAVHPRVRDQAVGSPGYRGNGLVRVGQGDLPEGRDRGRGHGLVRLGMEFSSGERGA